MVGGTGPRGGGGGGGSPGLSDRPNIALTCDYPVLNNVGETSERRGGAHMGLPERIDITLI